MGAKAPDIIGNVVNNCLILNYTCLLLSNIHVPTIDCAQLMMIAIATCTCTSLARHTFEIEGCGWRDYTCTLDRR